jgi:hypothetical protein
MNFGKCRFSPTGKTNRAEFYDSAGREDREIPCGDSQD